MASDRPDDQYVLSLSRRGQLNHFWGRWIERFNAKVIYDDLPIGDNISRQAMWDRWRRERSADGFAFDHYRELYLRIHGCQRQTVLCGKESGLGRKNIFQYFLFGQEEEPGQAALEESLHFRDDLIYHNPTPYDRDVFVAPEAKCQRNEVFTREFWEEVVRQVARSGFAVTVNSRDEFLGQEPNVQRSFVDFGQLAHEVKRHRLVTCGNTGIGWVAGACGVPLLAMQHDESNMQDYRYEWCGVESLVEFVREPDPDYVARRIREELSRKVVLTTGCYDLLHAGHVRHLEESRSYGDRLVVALNSDASVKRLKGEGRPHRGEKDRMAVLESIRFVDDVRLFDGDDALPIIHKLRPAVVTNGCDHDVQSVVGKDFVEAYGGQVVITGGERTVSTTRIIQKITGAEIIKSIKDAERYSVNPYSKLKFLADQVLAVEGVEGEMADLGTYTGGTALMMHQLAPDRKLHCFDTWDGMKEDDPLCHHRPGEWNADLGRCKDILGASANLQFHQGVFPETASSLGLCKFAVVYCDMDTYQSTMSALRWFWPRLEKGGRIIVDDLDWPPCAGCEKAVKEFFAPGQVKIYPDVHVAVAVKT